MACRRSSQKGQRYVAGFWLCTGRTVHQRGCSVSVTPVS
jgi:hypothetical protein